MVLRLTAAVVVVAALLVSILAPTAWVFALFLLAVGLLVRADDRAPHHPHARALEGGVIALGALATTIFFVRDLL